MPELQRLAAGHADAVLDFELANRAWFTRSISDRGDEYFETFPEQHRFLLDDQDAGGGAYHVLVDDDGTVLGRFNLIFEDGGTAVLGYRMAERAAGRGLATAAVLELCDLAATRYGQLRLRAATSHANIASKRVLVKAGFHATGPAGPADLGGKEGTWYQRDLLPRP